MNDSERDAADENDNESPNDGAYENELTEEEEYPTPRERADVADTQPQDP